MHQHEDRGHHNLPGAPTDEGFWRSRAGKVFIVFLGMAGLLLAYEHRAHIFAGNGFLILILLLCPAMHFFMHRGHGGHGK